MAWFRHDDNARNDTKLKALVDEFGLAGESVWWRLCEVRNATGEDIEATTDELAAELSLLPKMRFPLERFLAKARSLGLIRCRQTRTGRRLIHIRRWTSHNPEWATKEAAAERKRRSRERRSPPRPRDVTRDVTDDLPTHQPTATPGGSASAQQGSDVESVSNDATSSAEANGGVQAHDVNVNTPPRGGDPVPIGAVLGDVLGGLRDAPHPAESA